MSEPRAADDDTAFERCIGMAFRALSAEQRACFDRENMVIAVEDATDPGYELSTGVMVDHREVRLFRSTCERVAGLRRGEFWAEVINIVRETLEDIITQHMVECRDIPPEGTTRR